MRKSLALVAVLSLLLGAGSALAEPDLGLGPGLNPDPVNQIVDSGLATTDESVRLAIQLLDEEQEANEERAGIVQDHAETVGATVQDRTDYLQGYAAESGEGCLGPQGSNLAFFASEVTDTDANVAWVNVHGACMAAQAAAAEGPEALVEVVAGMPDRAIAELELELTPDDLPEVAVPEAPHPDELPEPQAPEAPDAPALPEAPESPVPLPELPAAPDAGDASEPANPVLAPLDALRALPGNTLGSILAFFEALVVQAGALLPSA